jgi:hypothetical protein
MARMTRNRHGLLLLEFRESRIDPRQYWGLPELREDALCFGQMLNREGALFLGLVKQAENRLCATMADLQKSTLSELQPS